jgi:hypothetical protein
MSKSKLAKDLEEMNEMMEALAEDTLADEDYCFILDSAGNLKTIMLPDDAPFELPNNVTKMLNILGIADPDNISGNTTLH